MAYALTKYTGDNATTTYTIGFTYRDTGDIVVTVAGVVKTVVTDYTILVGGTQIQFTAAPGTGELIEIKRSTSQATRLVDYAAGSVFKESDLDTDSQQAFFMSQEAIDRANESIAVDTLNKYDAGSKKISNVADPTAAQDAVTKNYLESTWLSTSDKTNLTTVAGKSAELALLGTADAIADMNTLGTADIVADMNTFATADVVADMNTLATADVVADLNTLATADVVADMNTLGTADVVSDMNTLGTAGNVTNMDTLAPKAADISTVAGVAANVTTVAGVSSDVTTVAGVSANVTTVAGISANVTTVATNVADVNSYANTYNIAASEPGSPSEGELWFDTTNDVMKVYDGGSWQSLGPSPTLSSLLIANHNQITVTSGGDASVAGKVTVGGDTAAGDDASIGYTAAEGLILTGQGSSSDITVKNDSDTDVITIATGTTTVDFKGGIGVTGTTTTEYLTATSSMTSPGVYSNTTGSGANVVVDSAGGFARSTSSRRYKNSIEDAAHGLSEVMALRPVTFKHQHNGDVIFGGLIAEEVHDAGLSEFVEYSLDDAGEPRPESLFYGPMVSLSLKAIQELKAELDAEKAKVSDLLSRVTALESGG